MHTVGLTIDETVLSIVLAMAMAIFGWFLKILFDEVKGVQKDVRDHVGGSPLRHEQSASQFAALSQRTAILESNWAGIKETVDKMEHGMERLWKVVDSLALTAAILQEQVKAMQEGRKNG